jgi:hypothetical protein
VDRVVDRQVCSAGDAEDVSRALGLEGLHQSVSSTHGQAMVAKRPWEARIVPVPSERPRP